MRARRAWFERALKGLSDGERETLRKAAALLESIAERGEEEECLDQKR